MHFVFSPPAGPAAGLLTLPWRSSVEDWTDDRVVEIRQRGLSRHVVRFVSEGGEIFALKELDERLARREYALLRQLQQLEIPAVDVLGIVVDRPDNLDAVLVTRFLDYSTSYRALFANPRGGPLADRLLDAQVELLVRLHLAGFMWGDCSLSNTLFRLDAGALSAYLVDAETGELHPTLSDGQRGYDVELAQERVGGELFDLQAGGLLPSDVDPVAFADEIARRYEASLERMRSEGATVIEFPLAEKQKWLAAMPDIATPWIEATERRGIPAGEALRAYLNAIRARGGMPLRDWDRPR